MSLFLPALAIALASAAAPAAEAPSVWVAQLSSTGLSVDEAKTLPARVLQELEAVNAVIIHAPTADDTCAADPSCVGAAASKLGAGAALTMRLVRGGPVLQVSTIVIDADGGEWFREERIAQMAEFPTAELLPAALTARLARSASGATTPTPDPDTASKADAKPEVTPGGEEEVPLLGVVGLGIAALGLVGGVVGVALAVAGNDVINDPAASGEDKANAFLWGPAGIGVAVVGGLIAVGGAVTAAIGLASQE